MMISIVIPFYNNHSYLSECLNSIRENIEISHELIIIDDASNDTRLLKTMVNQPDCSVIFNNERKGPAYSRNIGIERAKGDYVLFVDSDDKVVSSISPLFAAAEVEGVFNTGIDLFVGERCDTPLPEAFFKSSSKIYSVEEEPRLVRLNEFTALLYRRDFLMKHNIRFDPQLAISEDVVFLAQCLSRARYVLLAHVPFYFYRLRNESRSQKRLTHESAMAKISGFKIITEAYRHLPEAMLLRCVVLFSRNFMFTRRVIAELCHEEICQYLNAFAEWTRVYLISEHRLKTCLDKYYIDWNATKDTVFKAILAHKPVDDIVRILEA